MRIKLLKRGIIPLLSMMVWKCNILSDYMKIVKYRVEYRLLDDGGHILLKKNNIVDFNLSILCNFNINDIVNYEEFYQYYKNT